MSRATKHESELDRLIVPDAPVKLLSPRERCEQASVIVFMVFLGLGIGCAFVAIREVIGFKT